MSKPVDIKISVGNDGECYQFNASDVEEIKAVLHTIVRNQEKIIMDLSALQQAVTNETTVEQTRRR